MWISEPAYHCLLKEADRGYPLETGGILLGYCAENGAPVVLAVVGPGPDASHSRTRFLPDHEWQCKQIDEVYQRSAGQWVYIGDWHTHPDGVAYMSWLDQRTLRAIARHPEAKSSRPVMLIAGGQPERWAWKCHQYRSERLLGFLVESDESELRVFREGSGKKSDNG